MKTLVVITLVILMSAAVAFAGDETTSWVYPVQCGNDAVKPTVVAGDYPCPGGVYCDHYSCGQYCCPWGYFYSNPCTCKCYRSSYDAGSDCNTYFQCR